MANFSENFRGPNGPKACILCGDHLDNQETSFQCVKVRDQINHKDNYGQIFRLKIPKSIFFTLEEIMKIRENSEEKLS